MARDIWWYIFKSKSLWSVLLQRPKNVANLHAWDVYFKRQEMIYQCIITASFASGRKQTSHGVVRDIWFSVVWDTPDELYIQAPLEYPRLLQETFSPPYWARMTLDKIAWHVAEAGWSWIKTGCMKFKKVLYGTVLYGTFCKTLFERVSITFGQMLL